MDHVLAAEPVEPHGQVSFGALLHSVPRSRARDSTPRNARGANTPIHLFPGQGRGSRQGVEARFDGDYATVWRATVSVLAGWPLLEMDEAAGVIRSDWREERQPKRWDRLLTQRDRRHRLEIRLAPSPGGTLVSVALRTQSRPMGRYSAPWSEEPPAREQVLGLLDAIEQSAASPP